MTGAAAIDEVEQLVSGVEGWLSGIEGRLLYEFARHVNPAAAVVEIGSWKGKSTIWLAAGAKAGLRARVFAVDPHEGSSLHSGSESTEGVLRRNLQAAGVSDDVEVLVMSSEVAEERWQGPIGLLWIDGDHEYEGVRRDFELWEKHLVEGAIVALHDTVFWDGPRRVVSEFLERLPRYSALGHADDITYATKRLQPTMRQRLRKRLEIVDLHLYGVRTRAYADNRFHLADLIDALSRRRGAPPRRELPARSPADP